MPSPKIEKAKHGYIPVNTKQATDWAVHMPVGSLVNTYEHTVSICIHQVVKHYKLFAVLFFFAG